MQYLYYFANTRLVARILDYLSKQVVLSLDAVTVIYLVDRWVVRIKLRDSLGRSQDLDFRAFLNENGYPYRLSSPVEDALKGLDNGLSITAVMKRYHTVVISHGGLQPADLEDFRTTFVEGLGYCPPSLV
ncbi:MAG: hypothetical protein AAF050_16290 [Cyanobacteria bacterium J06649_5]